MVLMRSAHQAIWIPPSGAWCREGKPARGTWQTPPLPGFGCFFFIESTSKRQGEDIVWTPQKRKYGNHESGPPVFSLNFNLFLNWICYNYDLKNKIPKFYHLVFPVDFFGVSFFSPPPAPPLPLSVVCGWLFLPGGAPTRWGEGEGSIPGIWALFIFLFLEKPMEKHRRNLRIFEQVFFFQTYILLVVLKESGCLFSKSRGCYKQYIFFSGGGGVYIYIYIFFWERVFFLEQLQEKHHMYVCYNIYIHIH